MTITIELINNHILQSPRPERHQTRPLNQNPWLRYLKWKNKDKSNYLKEWEGPIQRSMVS